VDPKDKIKHYTDTPAKYGYDSLQDQTPGEDCRSPDLPVPDYLNQSPFREFNGLRL